METTTREQTSLWLLLPLHLFVFVCPTSLVTSHSLRIVSGSVSFSSSNNEFDVLNPLPYTIATTMMIIVMLYGVPVL